MAGNPNKIGKTGPAYQMGRRRHTRVPGYTGILPKVFPYRYRTTIEEASALIGILLGEQLTDYALTSHPSTVDGHIHLWLSESNAQFLLNGDLLHPRNLEEM